MDYQKIKIDTFNDEQNYWFVRTNGGSYYNEYKTKGFIAFGVNSICDTKLLEAAEKDKKAKEQLVTQIKADYENKTKNFNYVYAMIEYQPTDKPRKNIIKTGLIISQLNRFMREMKIGDIVLIPSVDSDEITFGKITSDYYIDKVSPLEGFFEYNHKCPFFKRRNVKWIKTIKKDDLEPFLYKVIYSHHSITDVSYARNYINRSLSDVYISNDKLYITFNINKKTGIPAKDLLGFMNSFEKIARSINLDEQYINELINAEVKLNIQSPGPLQYIIGIPVGIFILASAYAVYNIADRGGTINMEHNNTKIELNVNSKLENKYNLIKTYEETTEKISSNNGEVEELRKHIEKLEISLPNEQTVSK